MKKLSSIICMSLILLLFSSCEPDLTKDVEAAYIAAAGESSDDTDTAPDKDSDTAPDDDTDSGSVEDTDTAPDNGDTESEPIEAKKCADAGGIWNEAESSCTKTADCTDLPENAEWNGGESYSQIYTGGSWSEEIPAEYSEDAGECHFKCVENYVWDGSACVVSPCNSNPCSGLTNSTGICTATSETTYSCGCVSGYHWWGQLNGCQDTRPTLGNICTGQTSCYNNTKEISCPAEGEDFFGQDAQYISKCVAQSFSSSTNVVIDNNTGLTWEKSPSTKTYTWDNRETHCNELNSTNYGGINTWRVPNPLEFMTIVDNSRYNPATNSNFTNMPTSNYVTNNIWTSKEYKGDTNNAYIFISSYGNYFGGSLCETDIDYEYCYGKKTNTYLVLCVSGNEMQPATSTDFSTQTISGEVVVTDSKTELMWQKEYTTGKTWQAALKYCEDSTYAGYSDWRLPNKNELSSLINYEKPERPYSYFPDMPNLPNTWDEFWSSSTISSNTDIAWSVNFNYGYVSNSETASRRKSSNGYLRCVRNATEEDKCVAAGGNWNGSACVVSPCNSNPCSSVENSTGICTATSETTYSCGCVSGYHWWGKETGCIDKQLPLGNICTGQDKCYNNDKEITCPTSSSDDFFGQDAQYTNKCVAQSFTLGTGAQAGTVIDNNTALIWEQSPSENEYTWDDAPNHCNDLNSSNYGGKSNWRVPNPLEFMSIVDNSTYNPATNSNFTGMPTDSILFWTSAEYKGNTDYAYVFDLYYGYYYGWYNDDPYLKTKTYQVLCVSGDEIQPATSADFTTQTISGKVVVTDSKTGLMWQKEYATDKRWQQALKYCKDLTYAGYSDWRLPNKNELFSLINYEKSGSPYSYFPEMPSNYFWSSSTGVSSTGDAWGVNFGYGYVTYRYTNYDGHVRCVRNAVDTETDEETCTAQGGNWNGSQCTRTQNCTGLPENAEWNGDESYSQFYTGSSWSEIPAEYSEDAGECHFKCVENYVWDGSACVVSPCNSNPCSGVSNSTGICTAKSATNYSCGCVSGYHWWGIEAGCTNKQLTLGNICTGQTSCYGDDPSISISCPTSSSDDFFGQDAYYASFGTCTQQSFTAGTDAQAGTVIDNNTGLVWEQSPSESTYTWGDAPNHCAELNSSNFGGINTWRVPNPLEFMTIVDNSTYNPATNSNFTNMPSDSSVWFWTSAEYKDNTSYAYYFSPSYGWYWYDGTKTNTYKVLCVSGDEMQPATSSNFTTQTISGKAVVSDSKTGLMWQKEYATDEVWEQALKYCEDLTYAGYSDWRLPNKNELASLVNYEKSGAPYSYFPDMPSGTFWSSSTILVYIDNTWNVDFGYGHVKYSAKAYNDNVRCVRSPNTKSIGNICTGQDKCYDNSHVMEECPVSGEDFFGQDAQYTSKCTELSFTLGTGAQEGSVIDNNTGLIWEQSPSENEYTWDDAPNHCNDLNNSNFGGINTWRVPNPLEFMTIVDNSKYNPATNSNFTNMPTDSSVWFWTSAEYKGDTSYAYAFRPYYGSYYGYDDSRCSKTKTYKVLCVSGDEMQPATSANFTTQTISGKVVVTDSATGLMWQKEYVTSKTWQEALKYCEDLTYAGYSDWRLPNRNELASLINYEKSGKPYSYFPDMPSNWFWSSSTSASDTNSAWGVNFNSGYVSYDYKTYDYYVRCVR